MAWKVPLVPQGLVIIGQVGQLNPDKKINKISIH